jgi:hypothetical protein
MRNELKIFWKFTSLPWLFRIAANKPLFDFSITRIFSCYFIKEIISCCSTQKSEQQDALGFVPNVKITLMKSNRVGSLVVWRMKGEIFIEILVEKFEERPMCKLDSNIEKNVNCVHLA